MSAFANVGASSAPPPPAPPAPEPRPGARKVPRPLGATPLSHLRAAGIALAVLIVLFGVVYPLIVTGFAQLATPETANGSLVEGPNGTVVGSILVAQNLSLPSLFWERPSVTDYEMTLGTPAPLGPADPALRAEVLGYLALYHNYTVNGTNATLPGNFTEWILTDSASGVDPDLLPVDALVQIPRIAQHTHLSESELTALVNQHIQGPPLGLPGPSYVNVLQLDLALVSLPGY